MDMGTVLDGRRAVKEKLIDELGGLSDALAWLYKEIERGKALRLPAGRFELRSAFALRRSSGIIFLFAVPKRLRAFRNCLFTRGLGSFHFPPTKQHYGLPFLPLRGTIVESIIVSMGSWGTE